MCWLQNLLQSYCNNTTRNVKKYTDSGYRDVSVVVTTYCSSQRPGFDSQHPHGSSQLSVTPVMGGKTPSSGLRAHACTQTHTVNIINLKKYIDKWNILK